MIPFTSLNVDVETVFEDVALPCPMWLEYTLEIFNLEISDMCLKSPKDLLNDSYPPQSRCPCPSLKWFSLPLPSLDQPQFP